MAELGEGSERCLACPVTENEEFSRGDIKVIRERQKRIEKGGKLIMDSATRKGLATRWYHEWGRSMVNQSREQLHDNLECAERMAIGACHTYELKEDGTIVDIRANKGDLTEQQDSLIE